MLIVHWKRTTLCEWEPTLLGIEPQMLEKAIAPCRLSVQIEMGRLQGQRVEAMSSAPALTMQPRCLPATGSKPVLNTKVIFSDKSKFNLFILDGQQYCWRCLEEEFLNHCRTRVLYSTLSRHHLNTLTASLMVTASPRSPSQRQYTHHVPIFYVTLP